MLHMFKSMFVFMAIIMFMATTCCCCSCSWPPQARDFAEAHAEEQLAAYPLLFLYGGERHSMMVFLPKKEVRGADTDLGRGWGGDGGWKLGRGLPIGSSKGWGGAGGIELKLRMQDMQAVSQIWRVGCICHQTAPQLAAVSAAPPIHGLCRELCKARIFLDSNPP
jgi:hypothetical protein